MIPNVSWLNGNPKRVSRGEERATRLRVISSYIWVLMVVFYGDLTSCADPSVLKSVMIGSSVFDKKNGTY